ncbi:dedicator of cytokinesis-domain-containing protein [Fennellomyces sp. T-0311]|nr:dedicator of cytokinesis-domain-containing protein [Fennellomyces sp. T-0311]
MTGTSVTPARTGPLGIGQFVPGEFYGRGFPPSVRHQQFIYRGLEWEKMASFVERMQNQHPNAQLLPGKYATMSTLSEEQIRELDEEIDAQYLQITAVTAESTSNSEMLDNPLVPDSIKKYYMANEVAHFSYSRPFDKGNIQQQPDASKPETDFLNLWTKKTVFTSEETFPTTARRSKVVSIEDVEISPIENAVLAMEKKNEELCALANKYSVYLKQRGSVNISPFSMALNGAVDAPVNGGVTLYKKAFLTDWYWEKNPEMRSWVRRLRSAINDQVEIIEKCLEIHRKLVSSDMKPFHNTLVDFFKKNFKDEIEYVHRHKDTHQIQENEVHPLDYHHPPSEEPASHNDQPLQQAQAPRPPLARQNSQQSTLSSVSASLPMSPVFSSMRSPTDTRPPSIMMETIVDGAAHPPAASSRAESISRSLKMSLRMKKRPPAA